MLQTITAPSPPATPPRTAWPVAAKSGLRAAFGIIWAVDAALKWRPTFADHYVGYLQNASQGQPDWLAPWFSFWIGVVSPHAGLFVLATRLIESAVAVGLLLGLARKPIYAIGAAFSLLIWSTAEGFGGPYTAGATDPGPGLIYVLLFVALGVFSLLEGPTPYSLDYYLARRWPAWQRIAEWSPSVPRTPDLPHLSWRTQGIVITSIGLTLAIVLGSLQSALAASPATPDNAAAAVSPLSLVASTPPPGHDATLPPLLSTGPSVDVTIEATDTTVQIANGVSYQAWTFGGTVPGPILHVRQGQTVNVTFVNHGAMQHSIDFHEAEVAPNVAYRSINPGESLQFSFVANTPGAFVYHCGTPPVLEHMANGMYGAIVVDPEQPLPAAAASYVIVQSEWYTQQVQSTLMAGNFNKMQQGVPDEIVFNGVADQYKAHPLPVKAGERVRLYVVDAGPSMPSAFHVIGAVFAAVNPDAVTAHALNGVSTYGIAPGQGVVFDLVIQQPGQYAFVDHSMRDMMMGAVGVLNVTP